MRQMTACSFYFGTARRAGIRTLVLPVECRRDFDELADYLKDGLDVHYAREYSDVYRIALGDLPEA